MVGRQKPISAVDGASGAAAGRAPGAQLRTALSDGVEFLAGQAPLAVRRVIGGGVRARHGCESRTAPDRSVAAAVALAKRGREQRMVAAPVVATAFRGRQILRAVPMRGALATS